MKRTFSGSMLVLLVVAWTATGYPLKNRINREESEAPPPPAPEDAPDSETTTTEKPGFFSNFFKQRFNLASRTLGLLKNAVTGNLKEGESFLGEAGKILKDTVNLSVGETKQIVGAIPIKVNVQGGVDASGYASATPGQLGQQFGAVPQFGIGQQFGASQYGG